MTNSLAVIFQVLVFSSLSFANGQLTTGICDGPRAQDAAKVALQNLSPHLEKIKGAVKADVSPCSEVESNFATPERWVCGVLVSFDNPTDRSEFQRSFTGMAFVDEYVSVPVCSTVLPTTWP